MRITLLIIATLLWACRSVAQAPSFLHYGVDDGLPSNLVYSMTQDKEGFLWFGTDKGMARFDGQRFHVFDMSDGLPDMEILNIEADSKGRLWISPFKQNPCYWENGRLFTSKTDSTLMPVQLSASSIDFQEDENGKMWMFNGETSAFFLDGANSKKYELGYNTRGIFQKDGQTYIISLGKIILLKKDKKPETVLSLMKYVDVHKSRFISGMNFINDKILISTVNKLILIHYENGEFVVQDTLMGYNGRIFTTKEGDFILTTNTLGCIFFDCSSGKIIQKGTLLKDEKVNMAFEDRQGTLWFCTADQGLFALPQNAPVNYLTNDLNQSHNITALAIGAENEIIAGNNDGGIFILKDNKTKYIRLHTITGNNRVLKVIPVNRDRFFAATDETVFEINKQKIDPLPFISTPKSILYSNEKLWLAASRTLGYYEGNRKNYHAAITERRFTCMDKDSEDFIWAGGMDGIYSSLDDFSTNWGSVFTNLKTRIISIAKGNGNLIWISTADYGLLRVTISGGKITNVEPVNKIINSPIKNIKSIFVGQNDDLWLGTNKGVYLIKADLSVLHFDKHNGLADNDINTLVVQADTLWVGTTKGLTKMGLNNVQKNDWFPTFFSKLFYQVGENTVSIPFFSNFQEKKVVYLPANAALPEIQLAGLDYTSRGNIQFEYSKKEQFPPLKYLTINNLVSLVFSSSSEKKPRRISSTLNLGPRLIPGKYQLKVTAINTRSQKSTIPDFLIIVQQAFWYETIWFWLAIWTILLFIFRKLYQDRKAFRELNTSISSLRIQAIQAQLNPHFIGNSIYAIQQFFYPPNPEKASEYIELFNRLLRQSMLMSEQLFSRFDKDLEYYQDYLKMIQLRLEDEFVYQISGAEDIPAKTYIPAMILQPIIENATIHGLSESGNSTLNLSFSIEKGTVHCIVEDNGDGIKTTQERKRLKSNNRKSKGLELIRQKVDTLNRLHNIGIHLEITDLKDIDSSIHGTRVKLTYNSIMINKVVNAEKPEHAEN